MKKSWIAMLSVAVLIPVAALAYDDKPPSVEAVMSKLHKGKKSAQNVLKGLADAKPTNWDEIQKTTKPFAELGPALGKNDPPKGDKESWKKFSATYADQTKAIDDAAQAKDLDALKASQKALGASCKACHTAHRPPQ